ncbi:MAG: tetratricopeptide repeat protein [Sutterellaceae bacterium]|nr:tetratricopeptide repeat protein [Sutterellaceae bacterium]MDY2869243.1 tetratricopeptide repeat protein [Mesosutterella sp.]
MRSDRVGNFFRFSERWLDKHRRVLGDFYFEGRGIERSADKAKEAYEKSCSYQNPYGCESVGILYDEGIAVPKSEKEAFGYYKKALSFFEKQCGELDSRACVEAGDYHADGVGTERSAEKAREFYKTACDRDDETGCSKLSKLNR